MENRPQYYNSKLICLLTLHIFSFNGSLTCSNSSEIDLIHAVNLSQNNDWHTNILFAIALQKSNLFKPYPPTICIPQKLLGTNSSESELMFALSLSVNKTTSPSNKNYKKHYNYRDNYHTQSYYPQLFSPREHSSIPNNDCW